MDTEALFDFSDVKNPKKIRQRNLYYEDADRISSDQLFEDAHLIVPQRLHVIINSYYAGEKKKTPAEVRMENLFEKLLDTTISNKDLYSLLKLHPESAEFAYKKFPVHQSLIEELCDPTNPLFLEEVSERLKDHFSFQDAQKELESVKAERSKIQNEVNTYKSDYEALKSELEKLDNQIQPKKEELENLERMFANLFMEKGINSIKANMESVLDIVGSIIHSGNMTESMGRVRSLNSESLEKLRMLYNTTKEVRDKIEKEDFLNMEALDTERKHNFMEMEKLKELNNILADNSIQKNNRKAIEIQEIILNQFPDNQAHESLSVREVNWIISRINESQKYLELNENRISNLLRNKQNISGEVS